jgi:hypothetical protein
MVPACSKSVLNCKYPPDVNEQLAGKVHWLPEQTPLVSAPTPAELFPEPEQRLLLDPMLRCHQKTDSRFLTVAMRPSV